MERKPEIKALPNEPDAACDFNLRILLQSPARFVREKHGIETLERIAGRAGLLPADLDGKSNWGSLEQVETFLAGVRELVEDDEAFKAACAYHLKESFGAVRFLIMAMSPMLVYERMTETFDVVSRISRSELIAVEKNSVTVQYQSSKRESRLMCLSRQAQAVAIPTLWGLPQAMYTETSCISNGDDACEFKLNWYQHRRWQPS